MYCVYKHTSPTNKVYIGITQQNPLKRWKGGVGYIQNPHFYNAIKKYGWNNFKHEIVADGLTKEQAERMEISLIAFYDSANREHGYNVDLGGKIRGEVSRETREKQRLSHLGKKLPDEQKRKIGLALKGRKTSIGMLGKHHSEETKRKMSLSSMGQPGMVGKANPKSKPVINLTTGETFECIRAAAKKYGVCHGAIVSCCQGKTKHAAKCEWEYLGGDL